ncbi:Nuclear ribonuclease Z [Phytophthora palmivora]|uniref:Nuclear ribonuclease Z n=1 Tax=Phytophthora palmivora TaxID=4796 RepID=A0A2P4YR31_9STRA|nr:Nuclear ribonuclease Z [Phytophthora palmivora]
MASKVVVVEGYTLHMRCVAGIESCCYVDSIDVAFDLGCLVDRVVNKSHVFITHGHVDHIGSVVAHAARRALQKQKPAQYFVPAHLAPHLESILQSTAAMQNDEPFPAHIVPLQAFDEVHVSPKYMIRAVPTKHRVPSLGYILYEKKNRLKPEYRQLPGQELAALKRAGQEITSAELIPEIAYTGDTTIEVFTVAADDERTKDLLQVKVLITEATYADSKMTVHDAIARGHMHLDQLAAHERLFQQVGTLVLVHFSARYSAEEVAESVRTRLPPLLQQKTVLGC